MWARLIAVLLMALSSLAFAETPLVIEICGGSNSPPWACTGLGSASQDVGIALGYTIGHVQVRDTATGAIGRVPLSTSDPIPAPSGWTPGANPGDPPVPPSTVPMEHVYYTGSDASLGRSDVASAMQAYAAYRQEGLAQSYAYSFYSLVSVDGLNGTFAYNFGSTPSGATDVGLRQVVGFAEYSVCPTGYGVSGSECGVSDPSAVVQPSDNIAYSRRSGNTYFFPSTDPDTSTESGSAASSLSMAASGSSAVGGDSARGAGFSVNLGAGGEGSIVVSKANANGTTTQYSINTGPPDGNGASRVTGFGVGTVAGVGDLVTSTPVTAASDLCALHPEVAACQSSSFSGPSTPGLYSENQSGKTYSGVFGAFRDRITGSAFGGAVTGFFTVSLSGSCPSWTFPSLTILPGHSTPAVYIDVWCSPDLSTTWAIMAGVLLLVSSWTAFRWAVL